MARWAWTIGLALLAAGIWAVFRAAGDGPEPVVAIPGTARLMVEFVILGGAAVLLVAINQPVPALIGAALIVVDCVASWDRVARLLGLA